MRVSWISLCSQPKLSQLHLLFGQIRIKEVYHVKEGGLEDLILGDSKIVCTMDLVPREDISGGTVGGWPDGGVVR